jgi:hypothetical protein
VITLTQLAQSTEPVQFAVAATVNGTAYNPTSDTVAVAFAPAQTAGQPPDPTSGEWNPAAWEVDPGPVYWASILVGPLNGGVPLAAGNYICYVRVTDNPAVPVKPGAYLTIT